MPFKYKAHTYDGATHVDFTCTSMTHADMVNFIELERALKSLNATKMFLNLGTVKEMDYYAISQLQSLSWSMKRCRTVFKDLAPQPREMFKADIVEDLIFDPPL